MKICWTIAKPQYANDHWLFDSMRCYPKQQHNRHSWLADEVLKVNCMVVQRHHYERYEMFRITFLQQQKNANKTLKC